MSSTDGSSDSSTDAQLTGSSVSANDIDSAEVATAEIREDMVLNAVAFLKHPQVSSSPESSKRAFLEKKGLTPEEIAEAFKRAPQPAVPPPSAAPRAPSAPAPAAANAPAAGAVVSAAAQGGPGSPLNASLGPAVTSLAVAPQAPPGTPWTRVVFRMSLAAGACYLINKSFADSPTYVRAKDYVYSLVRFPSSSSTQAAVDAAAAAAAAAAKEAIEEQSRELRQSVEDVRALITRANDERAEAERKAREQEVDFSRAISSVKAELSSDIRGIVTRAMSEVGSPAPGSTTGTPERGTAATGTAGSADLTSFATDIAELKALLKSTPLQHGGASPLTAESQPQSQSNSNAVMDLSPDDVTRGVGGVRISNPSSFTPSVAASARYAGVSAADDTPSPSAAAVAAARSAPQGAAAAGSSSGPAAPPGASPPHPPSYMQVLEMLEKGQTPPGIRDIDDKPPNPAAPPPAARMARKPKPWEAVAPLHTTAAPTAHLPPRAPPAAAMAAPWLPPQRAPAPPPEPRIRELDNEEDDNNNGDDVSVPPPPSRAATAATAASSSGGAGSSSGTAAAASGSRSGWKPPSVPAMSKEAADALISSVTRTMIPGTSSSPGGGAPGGAGGGGAVSAGGSGPEGVDVHPLGTPGVSSSNGSSGAPPAGLE